MKKVIVVLLIVGVVWIFKTSNKTVSLGPGVMVKELPYQEAVETPVKHNIAGYIVKELADFRIKAKVLSREDYYFDSKADISPADFALGWGRMSDESVLAHVDFSQSGRRSFWHVKSSMPIPRNEVVTHNTNAHLIPFNDEIKDDIDRVRQGEIIEITGSLVEVISNDGRRRWKSSLTRNDTGDGACEVILVKSIRVVYI